MSKYSGFNTVELTRPKRSQFDLSHTKRLSTRAGRLTPVFISECIPGDTWNGSSEILVRTAPLLAPIYDFLTLYVHFFFVPNRLLWDGWEEFITGGRLGVGIDPVTAPVPPFVDLGYVLNPDNTDGFNPFGKSTVADYLGCPLFKDLPGYNLPAYVGKHLDVMPFGAFSLVWYEYYRDRNFYADSVMSFPWSGGDQVYDGAYFLSKGRCWEHEYFTSALPNTQRGQEVMMPLAGSGSVTYLDNTAVRNANNNVPPIAGMYGAANDFLSVGGLHPGGGPGAVRLLMSNAGVADTNLQIRNIDEVILENSEVSINDFRSAYALQVWLERNEIAGSRYNESTQAHFGVRPQDSRLQRPEYIGGGRIPIKISEIVSTAYSSDGDAIVPLANLAGHGITYGNTNRFHFFCPEHGFIIGIASIMSPPSYHQGLPRMFRRRSFLDYPWPTFAKLGEQRVGKAELFASGANLTEDENGEIALFGYQSRYADWKYVCNTSHGDFHDTLMFWTLVRDFADSPELGQEFTAYDDAVQNRVFAVNGTGDNFWLYVNNAVTVVRCLPYYGTPNTLGFV